MKRRSGSRSGKKRSLGRRIKKILLWLVIIIVLLLGIVSLVTYFYGNDLLKNYLITAVRKESKGLYTLQVRGLFINLLTGRINITGLKLIPDTVMYEKMQKTDTLSPLLITASLEKLQVRKFDFMKAVKERKIIIGTIMIESPEVGIVLKKPSVKAEKHVSSPHKLAIPLPKGLHSIVIRQVLLSDGKLSLTDQSKDTVTRFAIPYLGMEVRNIIVDAMHRGQNRLFNADDILLTLREIELKTKNGMYTISLGEIGLSTGQSTVWINDFHLKPNYSEHEFSRKLGYQMDRMDVKIPSIRITRLNLRQLLLTRKFLAGMILVEGLDLKDYRDKRVPMRTNFYPPMPHQSLLKTKTYIKIDSVILKNGKAEYAEQTGNEPGKIFFDKMNATLTDLTNDSILVSRKTVMELKGTLYFMGKGLLSVNIWFPLGEKKDAFTFSGSLSSMDLSEINPMLTKLAPAKISSGRVNKLVISPVQANNDVAIGELAFYYNDLTFDLLNQKTGTWQAIKTGVLDFAANAYVPSDNPSKKGKLTTGIIYFERNKQKSILNFLWKSVFSGLKSTMGINKEEQKAIKKEHKHQKKAEGKKAN